MNYYLNKQIEWFEKTQRMIDAAKSDRHRAILEAYLLHVGYELVGENARLFEPDLMVEDPTYRIIGLGSPVIPPFLATVKNGAMRRVPTSALA